MNLRRIACCLLGLMATGGGVASAWQSQLYQKGSDGHYQTAPLQYQARNWQLPDFSYTGFWLGAKAPGYRVPCTTTRTVSTKGDFSTALQTAINQVGSAGGGTVVIPAGTYTIKASVGVPYSKVAIVGAGSGQTVLKVPSSYMPSDESREGVISLGVTPGKSGGAWIAGGQVLTRIARKVLEGDRTVAVADGTTLKVGQWIVIQQYYWSRLVRRADDSGTWQAYDSSSFPPPGTPNPQWSFTYLRQIEAIAGKQITLDAPIPYTLDPLNNPIGVRSADSGRFGNTITPPDSIGLAGLTIDFADNATGSDGLPAGTGVYFGGVRNGWLYDVQVINFPRYGIVVDSSARITVDSSAAIRAQNTSGGGHGYGFWMVDSQNVLVRRSYAEFARHGFTNAYGLTSMIVYSRDEGAGARVNADDQHFGFSHQILWDRYTLTYGTGLLLDYRGASSSNAQESNLSSVVWNASDNGYRGTNNGGMLSLAPAADGYSIVVGGPTGYPVFDDGISPATGPAIPAAPGPQTGPAPEPQSPGSRDQNVLYEGLYQAGLAPDSLWEQQVKERLGHAPDDYAGTACVVAAPAGIIPHSTWQGAGRLVFNGDQLGYAVDFGDGCPGNMESGTISTAAATCKTNARDHNVTAGGSFSMSLLPSDTAGAVIANLGGPSTSTRAYSKLTFKIYPAASGMSFDLALVHQAYGSSGPDVAVGSVSLGPFTAGQWNFVSIPLSQFAVDTFDTVRLRSRGSTSAVQAWLDEMVLR